MARLASGSAPAGIARPRAALGCIALACIALGAWIAPLAGADYPVDVDEMGAYFDGAGSDGDFPGVLQCVKGGKSDGCSSGHAVLRTNLGSVNLIVPSSSASAVEANLGKKVVVSGRFYSDIDAIFVSNIFAK